jgi:hypothetical protein
MVLQSATIIPDADISGYAWNSLRRFHHIPTTVERISSLHKLDEKQSVNARKQAQQIRDCLIQSREYRDAANINSLATKPVLLYYSIMSLALAEILLKGDGMSSLEKARGENAHHGLELKLNPVPKGAYDLARTAGALRAKPMIVGNRRRGTFELWHRYAREDPVGGQVVTHSDGGTINSFRVLLVGEDERLGELPAQGISLLDCFKGSPSSFSWVSQFGVEPNVVRSNFSQTIKTDGAVTTKLVVHPGPAAPIAAVTERILMPAEAVNAVTIINFPSGYCLEWPAGISYSSFPPTTCWSDKEVRFLDPAWPLNEFGYFYLGLYILGNYARYFPDLWMQDVSAGAPLALAVEHFLRQAERRMALLTFSELSGIYQVERD